MTTLPLYRMAKVIRSKNAKPYRFTFDVLFDDRELFEYVRKKEALTPSVIARTFGVDESVIISNFIFEVGISFNLTRTHPLLQKEPRDTDIYESQQHASLMYIKALFDGDSHIKNKLLPEI